MMPSTETLCLCVPPNKKEKFNRVFASSFDTKISRTLFTSVFINFTPASWQFYGQQFLGIPSTLLLLMASVHTELHKRLCVCINSLMACAVKTFFLLRSFKEKNVPENSDMSLAPHN